MPGVSITQPETEEHVFSSETEETEEHVSSEREGKGYMVEKVVVCCPVSWASDKGAVRMLSPGIMLFNNVDFPTPLFPDAGVTDVSIDIDKVLLQLLFFTVEKICLVKEQDNGHVVGLCRSKEAVNESRGCLRVYYRNNKYGLVDIGGENVALPTEVLRTADDVVTTVADRGDECPLFHFHPIANGHGVCRSQVCFPYAEIALDLTKQFLAIVSEDGVPGTRIFDY